MSNTNTCVADAGQSDLQSEFSWPLGGGAALRDRLVKAMTAVGEVPVAPVVISLREAHVVNQLSRSWRRKAGIALPVRAPQPVREDHGTSRRRGLKCELLWMAWRAKRRTPRAAVYVVLPRRRSGARYWTGKRRSRSGMLLPGRPVTRFVRLLGALALLRDHCLAPDSDNVQSRKRATHLKLSRLADVAAMKAKVAGLGGIVLPALVAGASRRKGPSVAPQHALPAVDAAIDALARLSQESTEATAAARRRPTPAVPHADGADASAASSGRGRRRSQRLRLRDRGGIGQDEARKRRRLPTSGSHR